MNDPAVARIGLVSNPGSGHNRDRFARVCALINACPRIEHRITNSAADIPGVLADLAAQEINLLAINGGDGTSSAVLGHLLEYGVFPCLPTIVLLPGGTANMNAGDVGVCGSLEKAVRRFCRWCESGRPEGRTESRALMRVSVTGWEQPVYTMFMGAGAVLQATEYAHREVHSRGLRDDFSLALVTLRAVWGVLRKDPCFNRPVTLRLALDGGGPRTFETLIFAASSLHRLAFGMRPFWGKGEGTLRLTLVTPDARRFLGTFISIVRGRPNANAVPERGYYSFNANRLQLTLQGALNMDGEIIEVDGPVNVAATQPLRFLCL